MSKKLQLGEVLQENIPAFFNNDVTVRAEVLGRFESDLEQIDGSGGLGYDRARDLVWDNSWSQANIDGLVVNALSHEVGSGDDRQKLFLPGASTVSVGINGCVNSVYHDPNTGFDEFDDYGNQLKWAFEHAAYAAIAAGATKLLYGPETPEGYLAVENTIRVSKGLTPVDQISDIPFKQRHHLGGAFFYESPISASGGIRIRKDPRPLELVGVSGVIVNPGIQRELLRKKSSREIGLPNENVIRFAARLALGEGVLDNFQGDLFAGSADSAVARFIARETVEVVTLSHIPDEIADGMNVH